MEQFSGSKVASLLAVLVEIKRFTNDSQPGWVECCLIDALGKEWVFEEKVPVVSTIELDKQSHYPQPGIIACQVVKRWRDANGRAIVTIDTEHPWGVEASDGTTRFDVALAQLREI